MSQNTKGSLLGFTKSTWRVAFLKVFAAIMPFTNAQGKNAESETMSIDYDGKQVEIRLTYPFTSKMDGIVIWINDGKRDSFIANVAQRYYDVRATL